MCCFKATFVHAQTKIKLSGKVTDQTNLGIPGATVFSGSPLKSLTATNGSGEFVIMIESEAELVFKSIGFMEYRVKLIRVHTYVRRHCQNLPFDRSHGGEAPWGKQSA